MKKHTFLVAVRLSAFPRLSAAAAAAVVVVPVRRLILSFLALAWLVAFFSVGVFALAANARSSATVPLDPNELLDDGFSSRDSATFFTVYIQV